MMLILLAAAFLAGATIGVFLMLVISIHIEERRFMTGETADGTRVEIAARQFMGVRVRKAGIGTHTPQMRK